MEISFDAFKKLINTEDSLADNGVGIKKEDEINNLINYSNKLRLEQKYDEAILWVDKAQKLDKNNSEIYFVRGLSHFDQGDFITAFQDFSISLLLSPGNVQNYIHIGNTLGQIDKHTEAIVYFTKGLEVAKNNNEMGMLLYNRAVSKSQLKEDYVSDFKMAAEINFEPAKSVLSQLNK